MGEEKPIANKKQRIGKDAFDARSRVLQRKCMHAFKIIKDVINYYANCILK